MTSRRVRKRFDAFQKWKDEGPVRMFRKKRKWTITRLAEEVHCSHGTVSHWEEHGGEPKKYLVPLAEVMNIHPVTLIGKLRSWKKKKPA